MHENKAIIRKNEYDAGCMSDQADKEGVDRERIFEVLALSSPGIQP